MFTFGGEAISWRSVKQSSIANSTIETKYIASSEAAKETVWLRNFLMDLGVVPRVQSVVTLYYDNSRAIANSKKLKRKREGELDCIGGQPSRSFYKGVKPKGF